MVTDFMARFELCLLYHHYCVIVFSNCWITLYIMFSPCCLLWIIFGGCYWFVLFFLMSWVQELVGKDDFQFLLIIFLGVAVMPLRIILRMSGYFWGLFTCRLSVCFFYFKSLFFFFSTLKCFAVCYPEKSGGVLYSFLQYLFSQ